MAQEQNVTPLNELAFDGERFVPGAGVEITYHHWLRYHFAAQFAPDKRVLDVASGEGYGAAYLAGVAKSVQGFDLSAEAMAHARATYGDNPRVTFVRADIETFFREAQLASFDVVTAYEVIEHVDEQLQMALLEGIAKVLAPGGIALISTPDRQLYSDAKLMKNPFHVREMYRDEFAELVGKVFPHVRVFDQLTYTGSAVVEGGATSARLCEMGWTDLLRLKGKLHGQVRGGGEYVIAVVSKDPLPAEIDNSMLLDRSRRLIGEELDEVKRSERHARDMIEDLHKQIAAIKEVWIPPEEGMRLARREAMLSATIDHLLQVIERNAVERAQGNADDVEHWRAAYAREKQQLDELKGMVSMRLVGKAKQVWDRFPMVKRVVKAVVKKIV